ncbi:MAG TPA: hydroxyisourate hydrolase [Pseudonocardiaceae bacterium]|nr:hydroxyisourate hydrolase [Pseudonocardiaceae bacterium]
MTSTISTHVLDTALGRPAAGVAVALEAQGAAGWAGIDSASTDADGRVSEIGPAQAAAGNYRLTFDTGGYFGADGRECFFPEVTVTFTITDPISHYHVPILLSPFSVSTYRGS